MQDRLIDVLMAIQTRGTVTPPNVPCVELLTESRLSSNDASRIQDLQRRTAEELEIQLTVVGGGIGCSRVVITVECPDVEEAKRLLNELFSNEWFSGAAIEAGFESLLRHQPYTHKTLSTGRLLGTPTDDSLETFLSYAHEDEEHCQGLTKHLAVLSQQGLIRIWHDRAIVGGSDWARQIEAKLSTTRLFLLLISADFFASKYCTEVELPYATSRHEKGLARLVPIVVRPVDWEGTFVSSLQSLPKDGKPVTQWQSRDEAWTDVARQLRRVVRELRQA